MTLTKTKIAMLLLSAAGALFASHKHQKDEPGIVNTLSTVTITGAPTTLAPVKDTAKDEHEPCVCPPAPADTPLGQR